jgi:hypothetical protein
MKSGDKNVKGGTGRRATEPCFREARKAQRSRLAEAAHQVLANSV